MAKTRRTFTREFKVEVVRPIDEQGKSLAEVARELGLSENMLRNWKQALAAEGTEPSPARAATPPWRGSCVGSEPRSSASRRSETS